MTEVGDTLATVVLVHGGWAGAWIWHDVIAELDQRDVASRAVDLPSSSAADPSIDFRDDARHVRDALDAVGGPVVLVGNSYGGLVITEAAAGHPLVKRLVYLAAQMPTAGQTFLESAGPSSPELASALRFRDDGLVDLDVEPALKVVMQHADERARNLFRAHVVGPMSFGTDLTATVSGAAWATIPSTYVVSAEDLAVPPEHQREIAKARATEVVEWPSDHVPQLSRPRVVADLLERLANGAG
jgi:pimeloyl-ACP methyl ester carboxylesterase